LFTACTAARSRAAPMHAHAGRRLARDGALGVDRQDDREHGWGRASKDGSACKMVGPWPNKPYTFRALAKTYGPMWLRCDVCRRYVRLRLAGLHDVDYRTKSFSCSKCGAAAYIAVVEPIREMGMEDYRLDEIETPARHPAAVERLTGRSSCASRVDHTGGELPGRNLKGRR
jgi:hypothetical protein